MGRFPKIAATGGRDGPPYLRSRTGLKGSSNSRQSALSQ